jgi:hypothetical protein
VQTPNNGTDPPGASPAGLLLFSFGVLPMATIEQLYKPRWQQDDVNWLMIVGNRTVAALISNSEERFPQYKWMSVILAESPFDDHGWCAVDFATLEIAQYDIEQWWHHAARGERYVPRLHCDRPNCGCRAGT